MWLYRHYDGLPAEKYRLTKPGGPMVPVK